MEQKTKDLYDDLAKINPIASIAESELGKLVHRNLIDTVLMNMNLLCDTYITMSHIELISAISEMKANRDIARIMSSAKGTKEFLEDELKRVLEQQ